MMEAVEDEVKAEELVQAFIKIRNARAKLKSEFEEHDGQLEVQGDALKEELLLICKEQGADNIRTKHGTAIRSIKEKYWTSDWASFHDFMLEHRVPELLEKRIAQANTKQFMEENPDIMPPGLNIDREYVITVRKPK